MRLTTLAMLAAWVSSGPLVSARPFFTRPVPISASPLYQDPKFFPTIFAGARYVRYFLNPSFQATIGPANVQRLDSIINQICFASDSNYHLKTCQKILTKLDRLAGQSSVVKKSQRYRELLAVACISVGPTTDTCQPLLADADCFSRDAIHNSTTNMETLDRVPKSLTWFLKQSIQRKM